VQTVRDIKGSIERVWNNLQINAKNIKSVPMSAYAANNVIQFKLYFDNFRI